MSVYVSTIMQDESILNSHHANGPIVTYCSIVDVPSLLSLESMLK
jgi:hypothetical protein